MERTDRTRGEVMTGLLERWFEQATRHNPIARLGNTGFDPFRNPVEYTLRENLATLLEQALGDVDPVATKSALENIIRIRAVQDISQEDALDFISLLKPILIQNLTDCPIDCGERIDQMAAWAAEEYADCRVRIANLRSAEGRRGLHLRRAEKSDQAQSAAVIAQRQAV